MKNLPPFFIRRYDSHKLEKVMKRGAIHAYWDTRNKEDFKVELARTVVEAFFYTKYDIDLGNIPEEEWESIIDYVIGVFGPLMDMYYRGLKKDYPMG